MCVLIKVMQWCKGFQSAPSVVGLSSFYQDEDLALKPPKIIVNKELDEAFLLKSSSKSDENFQTLCFLGLKTCRQHQYWLINICFWNTDKIIIYHIPVKSWIQCDKNVDLEKVDMKNLVFVMIKNGPPNENQLKRHIIF